MRLYSVFMFICCSEWLFWFKVFFYQFSARYHTYKNIKRMFTEIKWAFYPTCKLKPIIRINKRSGYVDDTLWNKYETSMEEEYNVMKLRCQWTLSFVNCIGSLHFNNMINGKAELNLTCWLVDLFRCTTLS